MPYATDEITRILNDWGSGDRAALERLIPLVYDELHQRAQHLFWQERRTHTLQPTALVNEAYLRLIDENTTNWESRSHFFRVATRTMRQSLIDHARRRLAQKRGAGVADDSFEDHWDELLSFQESGLIALNDALEDLAKMDARQCRIVELRFFAGLTIGETAEALGCSKATVNREWRSARVWLRLQLKKGGGLGRDSARVEAGQERLQ